MIKNNRLNQSILAAAIASAAFVGNGPVSAQSTADQKAARSVVRIDCVLPGGGEKKATGFVWPEPGFVVTALHAVAGCEEIRVHSEATGVLASAKVERALLAADLALIRLSENMGLQAVDFQSEPPNIRSRFFIWGYPLIEIKLSDKPISFAGGLSAGVTTLDEAFASDELDKLFMSQDYPTRDTQILRVTTTIQPGHSGAPIFSELGQVVAIADGGLLDGWRGVNWSIPAYLYLPSLPGSNDAIPKHSSQTDVLHSQVTAALTVGPSSSPDFQSLTLVRSLTLENLAAIVPSDDFYADLIPAIRQYAPDLSQPLGFDIFEDAVTGATLGVPSGAELRWNAELGIAEAIADGGDVRMYIGALQAKSFQEAKEEAARVFVDRASTLADWDERPADFTYSYVYDDSEYDDEKTANFAGFFDGTDRATGQQVSLQLDIDVSGRSMMGWAVYSPEQPSDKGAVALMMMQLAGEKLSEYALK